MRSCNHLAAATLVMAQAAPSAAVPPTRGPTLSARTDVAVLVGRFDTSEPKAIRFSLPGSKIGVAFTGSRLDILLGDTGHDAINCQIDGGAPQTVLLRPSGLPQRYTLAQHLADDTPHIAWITKRTEAHMRERTPPFRHTGTLTFGGFAIDANAKFLAPPAPRPHLIEAIGDSGFAAYAVEQLDDKPDRACSFRVTTQNAELSLPAFLGQRLNSEVINLSASGVGMHDSTSYPNRPDLMLPALYNSLVPPNPHPAFEGTHQPIEAVVIDGGANDLMDDGKHARLIDHQGYVDSYLGLLAQVRRHHPQAMIFCVVSAGPRGKARKALKDAIAEVVTSFKRRHDKRIVMTDYFANDPNGWESIHDAEKGLDLGHTCQGHRSPKGAAFLADRLAAVVGAHLPR